MYSLELTSSIKQKKYFKTATEILEHINNFQMA